MQKIILKRADEINFNKYNGRYHLGFECAKTKLGKKTYQIYQQYHFYGSVRVHIKELNGEVVRTITGEIEDYPLNYFKTVK